MITHQTIVPAKGNLCGDCLPARYIFSVFGCIGVAIIYGLKVNFHVAVISMVDHTHIDTEIPTEDKSSICNFPTEAVKQEDGPLKWNTMIQGIVLSSYFIGYLIGQLPGGRSAEKYNAKWVFLIAVAVNVVGTVITPIFSHIHYSAVLVVRLLMGFGGGLSFPAMHCLLSHWAPPREIGFMSTLTYAGLPLGTVSFMLTTGIIAKHVSWEAVFYIQGGVSSIWMIFWIVFVEDTPFRQKYITEEERNFIQMSKLGSITELQTKRNMKVPWKNIMTSKPFQAIIVSHFCSAWGFYMLLIELPQYMKRVLSFTITQITTFTSIPYLTMWMFGIVFSKTIDNLISKEKLSTTTARKIAVSIQATVPSVCLTVICIFHCNQVLGVVLMTIAITCFGSAFAGVLCNHLDISPNFAGTLMAITNTFATLPAIIVPIIQGQFLHRWASFTPWYCVFLSSVFFFIVELVVYDILGSAEVQPWNNGAEESLDYAS